MNDSIEHPIQNAIMIPRMNLLSNNHIINTPNPFNKITERYYDENESDFDDGHEDIYLRKLQIGQPNKYHPISPMKVNLES